MAEVLLADGEPFELAAQTVIVGAGAAGLVAALRAREAGVDVLVLERDALPQGSTALSAGLIPAAETRFQRAAGVVDSVNQFAADILRKADNQPDPVAVDTVTRTIGPVLEWLADRHGLAFSVITNFTYPGHTAQRMHGLPNRSGVQLMDNLRRACEDAGIDIVTGAHVTQIFHDASYRVTGVGLVRPDGSRERIGCNALILACNGYGGNAGLVARHVPEMAGALYFGHVGNQGDALVWGAGLGARLRHLSGYQGHGSVAHPHSILISWATIVEGGFQVNLDGERFANEAHGYSEAAAAVIAQPKGLVWTIFDDRIASIAHQFEDFRNAKGQGALRVADTMAGLAEATDLPVDALEATCRAVSTLKTNGLTDAFGRDWTGVAELQAPFFAVRVTGALFHTQGGLVVDSNARVLGVNGKALPNLLAAGGAACGVSGDGASGYLSGNGLLTAVAYGFLAGAEAARQVTERVNEFTA